MNVDAHGNTSYHVKEFVDHERKVRGLCADDTYIVVG